MPDLLVKLYALPEVDRPPEGCHIRRPLALETTPLVSWIADTFSRPWADEAAAAMVRQPPAMIVALSAPDHRHILGFCAYDATARGLLGPMGVHPECRGKGIGKALLLAALRDMFAHGYAYAIVGGAGPAAFYMKTAGAVPIEGSEPGFYAGRIEPAPLMQIPFVETAPIP
jgi:predicted N-acetyltransferase YhbS